VKELICVYETFTPSEALHVSADFALSFLADHDTLLNELNGSEVDWEVLFE